ncbi:MAG: calpastatin [Rhodoferax sp.]|nr:calpastatin [Rhodoferax sp.]
MNTTPDFDLERFVAAQAPVFADALAELQRGRKTGHWMWFVFPQLRGLGQSHMAWHYGIASAAEAQAYLAHAVLGPRLHDCCDALLALPVGTAASIFGSPDDLKLKSSMTLFEAAASSPDGKRPFQEVLARFYAGQPDPRTLALLSDEASASL